ncbi:nucleolar protein 4-like isoform X2 [Limulus polyphemus]|uniref:Nucleolar protein 4-like isoform X2 n=1 Tax=Limulus polyphemus TaxID=6850 RepID=A0ABM1SI72_LIMPO|nr:nucleolar protein 4-like isoform X2 [Limulus polyphemus]
MERRHNTRHAAALAAAAAAVAASSVSPECPDLEKEKEEDPPTSQSSISETVDMNKREMYDRFKCWAMKTYGDSAKTKTVTRKKYSRIMKILKGEEHSNAENSKFRFWVKAKGFRIGPPTGQRSEGGRSDQVLYVPCTKLSPGTGKEDTVYKKVAVVENFFNIIYEVHVDKDVRGGKHAGQKRTYKTIAETYAFLPREAVTHFLMSCADCQKRMHVATECDGKSGYYGNKDRRVRSGANSPGSGSPVLEENNTPQLTTDIDYNLPITTTYLKRMRSLGFSKEEALNFDREEITSNTESESSENETAALSTTDGGNYSTMIEANGDEDRKESTNEEIPNEETGTSPKDTPLDMSALKRENGEVKCSEEEPINMIKTADINSSDQCRPLHYWTSPNIETSATLDGIKEDEDDDEEDDTDRIDVNAYDPERLKAFNMFVRLFIDENLDRMVPISRQPKDKIQAIIDSCSRQFPEFSDRARKRIRTYLKSCRRTKRARDHNGWDFDRSAPHLSSPLAEQILSIACDNESQNAKRMRLGLKPISVSLSEIDRARSGIPSSSTMTSYTEAANTSRFTATPVKNTFVHPQETQLHAQFTKPIQHSLLQTNRNFPASMSSQTSVAPTRLKIVNGVTCESQPSSNSLLSSSVTYRGLPQFHIAVTETTASHSKNSHQVTLSSGTLTNGPTDLTVKKPSIPRYSLNPNEANAVRQLIAGYRESATFLLRSADELEQLLMQQN